MKLQTRQRLATIAELVDSDGVVVSEGIAVLAPQDENNPEMGADLAAGRAIRKFLGSRKLDSQLEGLELLLNQIPAPGKFSVGDRVVMNPKYSSDPSRGVVESVEKDGVMVRWGTSFEKPFYFVSGPYAEGGEIEHYVEPIRRREVIRNGKYADCDRRADWLVGFGGKEYPFPLGYIFNETELTDPEHEKNLISRERHKPTPADRKVVDIGGKYILLDEFGRARGRFQNKDVAEYYLPGGPLANLDDIDRVLGDSSGESAIEAQREYDQYLAGLTQYDSTKNELGDSPAKPHVVEVNRGLEIAPRGYNGQESASQPQALSVFYDSKGNKLSIGDRVRHSTNCEGVIVGLRQRPGGDFDVAYDKGSLSGGTWGADSKNLTLLPPAELSSFRVGDRVHHNTVNLDGEVKALKPHTTGGDITVVWDDFNGEKNKEIGTRTYNLTRISLRVGDTVQWRNDRSTAPTPGVILSITDETAEVEWDLGSRKKVYPYPLSFLRLANQGKTAAVGAQ